MMVRVHGRAAAMGSGLVLLLVLTSCGDDRAATTAPEGGGHGAPEAPGAADPCDTATLSLRALYDTVRHCSVSEDCQYVDGFYDLVPRTELDREITEFDCHEPTPFLVVANGGRVLESITDLQAKKSAQNAACRPNPDDIVVCEGFRTRLSAPPPVCKAAQCVASPES